MKSAMWYSRHYFHFVVILSISLHTLRNVLYSKWICAQDSMNRWCGEPHWSQASLGVYDRYLLRWFNGAKAAVHLTRGSKHVILSPAVILCSIFTRVYESIMCTVCIGKKKKTDFSLDTGISITVVCFIIMPGSIASQYDCANSQTIRTLQPMSTNWNLSLIREASFKISLPPFSSCVISTVQIWRSYLPSLCKAVY